MQEQQSSERSSPPSSTQLEPHVSESLAPDPTSQSTSDPAWSLRAVALSTLKSKRRKAANSQPLTNLPRPVITDNSVQLDYGQEDQDTSQTEVHANQLSLNAPDPSNDSQTREEGEISDSEEALASRKTVEPLAPSDLPPSLIDPQLNISGEAQSPQDTVPRASALSTSAAILKTESPPPPNLLDRISEPQTTPVIPDPRQRGLSESSHVADNMDADTTPFVDENHVRPGLNMNQHQYDTAKDIILDLLGWGVPPGYLVDCGLSREIVFYAFSELNLCLPEGFDTHGLIPYNPSTVKMLIRGSSSCSVVGLASTSDAGSPSKSVTSPDTHTLHDMEKQRRQELLARKAVYASRKGKPPMTHASFNGLPTEPHKEDVEMSVPTETVDNFLKTIESGDEPRQNHPSQQGNEDDMDVDFAIRVDPGQAYVDTPIEPPTSSDTFSFGHTSRRSSSSGDVSVSSNGQKRGTKRPVAADFVDFDNDSRMRNGHSHPTLKRKAGGSFASISATRRCVIDLSDDEEGGSPARFRDNGSGYDSPAVVANVNESNGGYSTPPVAGSSTSTPRLSPGVLAEKERQIEEMRQKIAQREKSRVSKSLKFKKLAIASTNGTLTPETSVSVKQEEDESVLASETVTPSTTDVTINHVNAAPPTIQTIGASANEQNDDHSSVASTPPPIEESKETSSTTQNPSHILAEAPVHETESDQADIVQDLQPLEQTTEMVDVEPKLSSSAQVRTTMSPHHPRHDENQGQSQEKLENQYPAYQSIFAGYPLLRSPLTNEDRAIKRADENSPITPSHTSTLSSTSFTSTSTPSLSLDSSASSSSVQSSHSTIALPDLNPLKLGVLTRALDPFKPICQYEIPGGGVCRDAGCEDNHLSRVVTGAFGSNPSSNPIIEPSNQDTADYLANFAPESWKLVHGSMVTSKIIAALEEARVKNSSMSFDERVASAMATLQSQCSSVPAS